MSIETKLTSADTDKRGVSDWLQHQHVKNMLERLPRFEHDTYQSLDTLSDELRKLRFIVSLLLCSTFAMAFALVILLA